MATTSVGFAIATTALSPSIRSGRSSYSSASASRMRSRASGVGRICPRSTCWTPVCRLRACEISASVAKPSPVRMRPSLPPVRSCSARARSSWACVTTPCSIRISPSFFFTGCSAGGALRRTESHAYEGSPPRRHIGVPWGALEEAAETRANLRTRPPKGSLEPPPRTRSLPRGAASRDTPISSWRRLS